MDHSLTMPTTMLCHCQVQTMEILYQSFKWSQNWFIEWFKQHKMQANPDRFQVTAVGKKSFNINPTNEVQISKLTCEKVVKLLGMEINNQLKYDIHIGNINVEKQLSNSVF